MDSDSTSICVLLLSELHCHLQIRKSAVAC
mgnify:CR=1 FL=1